ncbi:MAG: hypothetical protein V2B17_04885 [Chloroflexota bacterium]
MSWFDEPARYYNADRPVDWSLGDLVVAPQAVLWAGEVADALVASPGFGVRVRRALWRATPDVIGVSAEGGWGLGMIVLDDCAIDRDFNREVNRRERALRAGGLGQEEAHGQAEAEARAIEDLDPTLVVASVRPYGDFEAARHDALRQAETFGYFPVLGTNEVDDGVVDFNLLTTVDRRALIGRAASLSEIARNALRSKLAEFTALRARSTETAIEAAVGRLITGAQAYRERRGKRETLVVRLELDHGAEVLVLEGR